MISLYCDDQYSKNGRVCMKKYILLSCLCLNISADITRTDLFCAFRQQKLFPLMDWFEYDKDQKEWPHYLQRVDFIHPVRALAKKVTMSIAPKLTIMMNSEIKKCLIQPKPIPLTRQQKLNDALFEAINGHNAARVEQLLNKGANPNAAMSGITPLMLAPTREIVEYLLAKGALIDAQDDDHKDTALMHAILAITITRLQIQSDYLEVLRALIDAGADVTIVNDDLKTAADYANNIEDATTKSAVFKILRNAKRKLSEERFSSPKAT